MKEVKIMKIKRERLCVCFCIKKKVDQCSGAKMETTQQKQKQNKT